MTWDREKFVRVQASLMCLIAGVEPIDSMDGSSNWWIFNAEAEKIVDDIQKRFPGPASQISGERGNV